MFKTPFKCLKPGYKHKIVYAGLSKYLSQCFDEERDRVEQINTDKSYTQVFLSISPRSSLSGMLNTGKEESHSRVLCTPKGPGTGYFKLRLIVHWSYQTEA